MYFAFACVDMFGHFMPLLPLICELLRRGHNVTAFLPDSAKYTDKLREYGASGAETVPVHHTKDEEMEQLGKFQLLSKGGPLAVKSEALFASITDHYRAGHTLPSVLVTDFFSTAAKDAGDALGVPVVDVFPNPLGIGQTLPTPSQRRLSDNIQAMVSELKEAVAARVVLALRNQERSLRNLPPLAEQDIWPSYTMKRLTINTWGLGYEYPFLQSPLLNYIGPTEPPTYPDMSGDLAAWFKQQTRPIVYVAFGTQYKFTRESCESILKGLANVTDDAAILWSLRKEQQSFLSEDLAISNQAELVSKIRIEAFVPQYAILKSPKVAVFVTHGGANSVGESILAETPMVVWPAETGTDQPANAARVQSAGVGGIAHGSLAGIGEAVRSVLSNLEEHRMKTKKLKSVLLSNGGAKRGADVLEAAASCGYEHMVPLANRFPYVRMTLSLTVLVSVASLIRRCAK